MKQTNKKPTLFECANQHSVNLLTSSVDEDQHPSVHYLNVHQHHLWAYGHKFIGQGHASTHLHPSSSSSIISSDRSISWDEDEEAGEGEGHRHVHHGGRDCCCRLEIRSHSDTTRDTRYKVNDGTGRKVTLRQFQRSWPASYRYV